MADEPLDVWFRGIVRKVDDAMEDTAEEVADAGQKFVYEAIDTRGTGKTWKRTYNGRKGSDPGRNASGQMRGDIEQETLRFGKDAVIASFGWLRHFEEYYGKQEVGFEHEYTHEDVPGMFAMADAKDYIFKYAEDLIGRKLRDL